MVKTPKQFLQLLRNTLVDNVRVHSAQLLADIELNLGGEPYVAFFDIVLSSHHICQPPRHRLDAWAAAIGVACQTCELSVRSGEAVEGLNTLRRRGLAEIMGRPLHFLVAF
jgi:hypothetical protein